MSIAAEKYVALTTYRKNGEPKSVPVWIADLGDGTVGFTTPGESYKCKRIRNDPRVLLQPSNAKGDPDPGSTTVSGTAALGTGADFDRVRAKIKAKYGIQVTLIVAMSKVAKLFGKNRGSDTAVIITLNS